MEHNIKIEDHMVNFITNDKTTTYRVGRYAVNLMKWRANTSIKVANQTNYKNAQISKSFLKIL